MVILLPPAPPKQHDTRNQNETRRAIVLTINDIEARLRALESR